MSKDNVSITAKKDIETIRNVVSGIQDLKGSNLLSAHEKTLLELMRTQLGVMWLKFMEAEGK